MKHTDDPALANRLMDGCLFASLAMTEADGAPYCVPISPAREGNVLYFHCGQKGRKLEALRRCPRVCLTCVGGAEVLPGAFNIAYQSAVAFGLAAEVTDPGEKVHALRLICEKYCREDMGRFQEVLEKYLPRTGVWKITLERVSTKS